MIKIIGLDIAKNVFQVHGIDETGQPALRRITGRARSLRWGPRFGSCRRSS